MTSEAAPLTIVALSTFDGEFLLPLVRALHARGLSLRAAVLDGVVRDRDRRIQEDRMRGFFTWPEFGELEAFAIPMYVVANHNSNACTALLQQLAPDILINAGTPRILRANTLAIPLLGVVNAHPGLLPKYRGCTCVEWAIYHDDPVGVTCHFMTDGIDEGPILAQEIVPIYRDDPYELVRATVFAQTIEILVRGVERIARERCSVRSLPPQGPGQYFRVIPDELLVAVKEKLVQGRYRCYQDHPEAEPVCR